MSVLTTHSSSANLTVTHCNLYFGTNEIELVADQISSEHWIVLHGVESRFHLQTITNGIAAEKLLVYNAKDMSKLKV